MFKVQNKQTKYHHQLCYKKRSKKDKKRSADIIRSRCQNCFVLQIICVQHSLDNPVSNNTYGPLYGRIQYLTATHSNFTVCNNISSRRGHFYSYVWREDKHQFEYVSCLKHVFHAFFTLFCLILTFPVPSTTD